MSAKLETLSQKLQEILGERIQSLKTERRCSWSIGEVPTIRFFSVAP